MNLLLLGNAKHLGPRIIEALRQAGHDVECPQSREEARAKMRQRMFDCILLSYALSNDTIQEFTELLRQHCPECSTIVISENGRTDCELEPSRTVHPRQGAEALLGALADIERRTRLNAVAARKRRASESKAPAQ